MVPDARIAIAHGRMEEHELSEIWRQLLEREIDILICTTIIETGVDVANCNTLVIENARSYGAVPALSAQRARRTLYTPCLCLFHLHAGKGAL